MTESNKDQLVNLLRQKVAEQDELRERFNKAAIADEFKEEIDLDGSYLPVTQFRADRESFFVMHTPTKLLNQWSATTGPRRLKESVEKWVDEIQTTFSPLTEVE